MARGLGAGADRSRAERQLARLRPGGPGVRELTARELEILVLIAEGRSNGDIAEP
ncbi:LuxR C-terminal-related transcriptional regulator [Blastococcus saxobsidens]|uniref:LuxR C-terminal-related transcriptional regulator n=1 Tax=Blastococcus saxobsidens TaxID=138336 RepID=UPI0002F7851A|nr:hypothetical protein [Blastococcus saxobsidens]